MATSEYVLLVEGKSDAAFFNEICKSLGLNPAVQVAPPRVVGGRANNKEGVFGHLPILLKQFSDGHIRRLALILDADHRTEHGLGFQRTIDRVGDIVGDFGFRLLDRKIGPSGILFGSVDNFHDLGLWVMPGNASDGFLEDWIKECAITSELPLIHAAEGVVGAIAEPKFKPLHQTKADVATWLAWQKAPGRGLEFTVIDGLLDPDHAGMKQFIRWLQHLYT